MNDSLLQRISIATDAWCDQNLPSDWSVNLPAYLATWEGKFAELIVQECLQMADEFELEVNRSGLVDRMKEHFGLEE